MGYNATYNYNTPDDRLNIDSPIGALKTQLSKLLMSVDRIGWNTGATSGRFDVRRMPRMLTGSERVFKSRVESEAVTTAVSIVVDLSGSMGGARCLAAAQTAWAMAEAIDRVGCNVQVVGFSTGHTDGNYSPGMMSDMAGKSGQGGGMESYTKGRMFVFKDWGTKLKDCKPAFEWMHRIGGGGTPDYHIVRTAVEQLANVPSDRKLCLVITDGCGDSWMMKLLCENSERKWGIAIVGIGIQTGETAMQKAFKYFACIDNVSDLATTAMRAVINQLSGKHEAAGARALAA